MTELGFDGKVAIITGAGGGLGRQHALLLASRGALVVVNDLGGVDRRHRQRQGRRRARGRRDQGRSAARPSPTPTRSPRPRAARPSCRPRIDAFGKVDIVINNAGILRDKAFHNMEPDLMNPVLDVHLKGAFHVTQPAWVMMREQGYGRIISTSSAAGIFGNFGQTNYGAAKMGLVGFTRVLAVEGAKYNIKANAIAPLALTRMTENIMGGLGDKLDPGLISPLVAYLAHEDCPRQRPACSRVGGGRVAAGVHRRDAGLLQGRPHARRTCATTGTPITDRDGLRRADQPRRRDGAVPAVLQVARTGTWSRYGRRR